MADPTDFGAMFGRTIDDGRTGPAPTDAVPSVVTPPTPAVPDTPNAPDFTVYAPAPTPTTAPQPVPPAAPASPPSAAPPTIPATTPPTAPDADDTLYLVTNGLQYTGWTSATITRGIEIFPSSFTFQSTEAYPTPANQVIALPGDSCQIRIGNTVILTGWIDQYSATIGPGQHVVTISGRSLCEDLVDCSVYELGIPGLQINQATLFDIAKQLCAPYKVPVKSLAVGRESFIQQFNVNLGETVYQVLERVASYEALLLYDDTDGSLIINSVGTLAMASGISEGVNVERAAVTYSMDQRYSEYVVYSMSTFTAGAVLTTLPPLATVLDPGVRSLRHLAIICEGVQVDFMDLPTRRALWEMQRRRGRSQQLTVTVDSWRDSARALWTPNYLVPLNMPHMKIVGLSWLISQVTFRRDANGTHADLVLMPAEAFAPQPAILQSYSPRLALPTQQPASPAAPAPISGGPLGS